MPLVYKQSNSGINRGLHHEGPFILLCAFIRAAGVVGRVRINDIVLGNVAIMNATSERRGTAVLSSLRVVMGKAFGQYALGLTYSVEITRQVEGLGKSRKEAAPKYTTPVDLRPLWTWLVMRSPVWLKQTTRARFQEKRSGTLAALRNDRLTRSDDESKWDPRQLQYFRCYSNKGELVTGLPLEQALSVVIAEDGFVEANYKDPKDPRKKGVWSDTVTHRPLRVQVVLDAKFSHLATKEAQWSRYVRSGC